MKIKNYKVLAFATFLLLFGIKPSITNAAYGDYPWNYNGYAIYYNNGAVGIGTNVPEASYKLQTLGGTDSNSKYNHIRFEHIAGRFWNIRTMPWNHSVYGNYGLVIEQPANQFPGCTGCGGDLALIPWRNVVMRSSNPGANLKLSVYGTVQAKEIIVTNASTAWPDYVFDDNYNLMNLSEVEKYIEENNHLPNIPSDVEVEANGVSIGEMQKKQMEKIEELTLYTIDQDKKIKDLETLNTELLKRIERLEKLFVNN